MTPLPHRILRYLHKHPSATVTEIADNLYIEPKKVRMYLKAPEAAGVVELRTPSNGSHPGIYAIVEGHHV